MTPPSAVSTGSSTRESGAMISLIAATVLSAALTARPKRKHRVAPARDVSLIAERIERRRAVRLAIIAALTRREAAIEDFLITTATETPLFALPASAATGPLAIGPTEVGVDFLGSPIIRSTVRNHSSTRVAALLVAHLSYGGGQEIMASVASGGIGPGESRKVELLCPAAIKPTALRWTIELLEIPPPAGASGGGGVLGPDG